MKDVTILIIDDHKLVRETWSYVLNAKSHYKVIAECGSGEEGVELAKQLYPDIVLMDINLPGMNGIEATSQIRKFSPESKVLGISLHSQPAYAKKMMQHGAQGYLTKSSGRDEMFRALEEVHAGKKYICEEIKNIITQQAMNGEEKKDINALSPREIEVIHLIREGYSSREIAEALNISAKTVEVHRYNILKKLGLKNTASLVHFINSNQI
jgi:two-component system invasion response regulator UvrY